MGLVPCDVNTHSTAVMMRQFEINPKYVMHIGAHDGIEADIYDHFNAKSVIWFECNDKLFEDLWTRLEGRKNHVVEPYCLWHKDGETLDFHYYRDEKDGASGLFENDKMFDYIKDCPIVGKTQVHTLTFDTWAEEAEGVPWNETDFLNIDVQGAELNVFKGAQKLLNLSSLKYIWCEVSWDHVYKNAPLMEDIDKCLEQYGFVKIGVRKDWEIHGDALYVKA
jgi:FkbM family methyltransferase